MRPLPGLPTQSVKVPLKQVVLVREMFSEARYNLRNGLFSRDDPEKDLMGRQLEGGCSEKRRTAAL